MVISKKPLHFIAALLVAFMPLVSSANPSNDSTAVEAHAVEATHESTEAHADASHSGSAHAEPTDIKSQVKAFTKHHVLDAHDFTFFSDNKEGKHYGFPLPIILWDNGFHIFSSSKFHHGEAVATGTLTEDEKSGHPTNARPIDFSITKSVLFIMITAILMFFLFSSLARSYAKNGGIAKGAGRIFEPLVVYIRDEIAIPNIGEKNYKKYMSYLLTIFFFILFLNIFGLTPLGVNVTGNLTITFSLAILTFLITNFTANKNYWGHIFWMPGVPKLMRIVLAPIELLGIIIKPFSLMIRLYANIFAGHIVLMSIIGLMFIFKSWIGSSLSLGLSFVLSILEILVAFLQAYIFTMLSALYFGSANEEHHHEEAHH